MNKKDKENQQYSEINHVLDKMLELKKSKSKSSFGKRCILVTACIGVIIFVITLCVMIYKNNFSFESLLSLLLAFFSIFISIFFYFKADETSNRFYETSYNFMKDVSVTLGKIEERFGEKLNTLNDKISHLAIAKEEKKEELENVEDERQKMLNELMEKAKLNDKQKEEYMERLQSRDKQIAELQQELMKMRHMERNIRMNNDIYRNYINIFNQRELITIQNTPPSDWPLSLKQKLKQLDMMDSDGDLTQIGRHFLMQILD